MKIYTIIVTWNAMRHQWIEKCLTSLQQSSVETTPVVIDNNSTDGTREYVPQHYPDAVWLPQTHNNGFGQANNIGMRYAIEHGATHVLLLNQDATLHHDALERLLEADDSHSLLSPLHLNGTGSAFDHNFSKYSFPYRGGIVDDILIRGDIATAYETSEICAACWLMPIEIINKIGGFNPVFFQYSEDNNYYHRMRYHGIRTLLVPRAKMNHDRIVNGDSKAFEHRKLRRALTLAAYDINNSISGCVRAFCGQLLSCYLRNLPHGEYIPGSFTYEALRLLMNIKNIRTSRRKEKISSPNWL